MNNYAKETVALAMDSVKDELCRTCNVCAEVGSDISDIAKIKDLCASLEILSRAYANVKGR